MEDNQTPPSGDEELRDKYSQADRDEMAKNGQALPDGSYPIKDREDVKNAVSTVGLGNAADSTIRKHIIARAKALGASDLIPDAWNADGSKQQNSSFPPPSKRRKERHRAIPLMPEVRHFRAEGLEIRSNSKTDEIVITGTPIVYDQDYTVHDMFGEFTERMKPGVATDALSNGADVRFLFNHDGLPLARTASGTMSLRDTDDGLMFSASLDARQQLANDLAVAIERGDVSQMSCGFIVAQDEWDESMEDRSIIRLADLLDVSAVTYPASPTTSISVAQRMALSIPVESRARLRMLAVDLRAGKALNKANADHLLSAISHLGQIADGAGLNLDPDSDGDLDTTDAASNDEPDVSVSTDGTTGGSDAPESGVGADGFPADQTRSDEPGEPIQYLHKATLDQVWLDSLIDKGEGLHGAARKRAA